MILVTDTITISEDDLVESFIRAPGAGGQNVNKVSSAVQLRFNARASKALSNAVFLRLKALAGRRMTGDGVLIITANTFRTQERNRKDARDRLADLVRKAAVEPKNRRPTRPTKASKTRRLDSKKRSGALKKSRGRVGPDD